MDNTPARDVWSNDPDRTTRRGDTQTDHYSAARLVAREAAALTSRELDELDPSPTAPTPLRLVVTLAEVGRAYEVARFVPPDYRAPFEAGIEESWREAPRVLRMLAELGIGVTP